MSTIGQTFKALVQSLFLFSIFMTFHLNSGATTIVSHRGASGMAPEHSFASLILAHNMLSEGDFVEVDLMMTSDGHAMVIHDKTLDATTDVREVFPQNRARRDGHYYVVDFTFKELKQLSLRERTNPKTGEAVFPHRFINSLKLLKIMSFEEYLMALESLNRQTHKQIGIYVEPKDVAYHTTHGLDLLRETHRLLIKYHYESSPQMAYLQSFEPHALIRLKNEFQTQIPLVQLIEDGDFCHKKGCVPSRSALKVIKAYAHAIGPDMTMLFRPDKDTGEMASTNLTQQAKEEGLIVHPYTLRYDQLPFDMDAESVNQWLFGKEQVHGVFTDFPSQAKSAANLYKK